MAEPPAPPPVDNPPPAVPPKADPDVAILKAKIAEYEAKEAAAAKAQAAAAEAERERLKRSGDTEKLLEVQNADLATIRGKLAEYEKTAPEVQALMSRAVAQAEALRTKLPESLRGIVDKMPTIAEKIAAAEELLVNIQPGGTPFKAPPTIGGGPPPPAGGKVDIDALLKEPGGLEKAKRDHPNEWAAYRKGHIQSGAATESGKFFQMFGKKKTA